MSYDPKTFKPLTFHDALARFRDGVDTPRAYLERAIETIREREPVVKAFAHLNEAGARAAADASTARWKAGKPLSPIDGMHRGRPGTSSSTRQARCCSRLRSRCRYCRSAACRSACN